MPAYMYICRWCAWEAEEFWKTLPEKPEAPIRCRACGKDADRNYAKEGFFTGNAKSEGFEGMSVVAKTVNGRGYVMDANNRPKEVRTFRDVEKYVTKDNHLGRPKMVQRRNGVTGAKEYVPMRDSNGTIQRDSERLIPLGNSPERGATTSRQGLDEKGAMKPKILRDPATGDALEAWSEDGDATGYMGHNGERLSG